jgi:hypothetical protein
MRRRLVTTLAAAALLAGSTRAQDAAAVIAAASRAIGVDSLKTVEFTASGYDFALGQAPNPSSPWPKFINKTYTRAVNFETPASRVDRVRMQGENPPHGGGQQPIVGEQPVAQTIAVGPDTPWVQQLEIVMLPHGFLRAAAARHATLDSKTVGGKKFTVLTFTGDNHAKVNGYLNAQNLLERVETWIDNPFLGDMAFESEYADYRDVGGVRFPMRIVQKQGGYPVFDLTVAEVKPKAPVTIQAPGRGPAPAPAPAPGGVPSERLGDGVYLLTGGYAAIAVDFKDGITIIESGARAKRAVRRCSPKRSG